MSELLKTIDELGRDPTKVECEEELLSILELLAEEIL